MRVELLLRSFFVFALLLGISALGCKGKSPPPVAKIDSLEVNVANPLQKEVTRSEEFLATLDAAETVQLRARVTGYLNEIKFDAGVLVKKNQVLFVIDKKPYEVDLKKAQADVKSADASLSYAKKEVARLEKGLRNGSVSREDYDKSVAGVAVAEASLEVANSSVERANLNLSYCEVKSPIDGKVSREAVTVGNLIQADNTVLTTIVSTDPIYAYFDIDERTVEEYLRVTEGKRKDPSKEALYPIKLALSDDVGFPHAGGINFAETRVDPQTGSQKLRGVFHRKDLSRELLPGFSARIRVPWPQSANSIVVPDRIIGTDQDRKFVFVVNAENKVESRLVKLGLLSDELRTITEGLTTKDRVVVSGMQSVRQGVSVKPRMVDLLTEQPIDAESKSKPN